MGIMNYFEPCKYSIRLIGKLKLLDTNGVLDFGLINKAIYFAKKYFPLDGYFNLLLIKLLESVPYLFIIITCKYFSSYYLYTIISTCLFSFIWFTAYHFYFNTVNIYQEQATKLINKFYKR